MEKEVNQIQQGDVLLERISQIPTEAKKLNHGVLAEGEATGHSHALTNLGVAMLLMDKDNMFLQVNDKEEAVITHQEHNPVKVPTGNWEVKIVQEYDPFSEEARKVRD